MIRTTFAVTFFCFIMLCVLLFVIAKIATISIIPKIILLSLIKIAVQYLKISVRYLKISGLKIAVHSLKIAGLKIIARVYARMYVRGCVGAFPSCRGQQNSAGCTQSRSDHDRTQEHERPEPERLDAGATTRAGTQAPGRPRPNRNAATRATTGTQRTRIAKRNYKNNSK